MTLDLKIALIGDKKLFRSLRELRMFVRSKEAQQIMMDAVNVGVRIARHLVPKKSRLLKSNIEGKIRRIGSREIQGTIGVNRIVKYAEVVEKGSVPHPIFPRNRIWLAWEERTGKAAQFADRSNLVFKKQVMHPGTKPQPYLSPAIKKVRPRLMAAIQRAVGERLGGR